MAIVTASADLEKNVKDFHEHIQKQDFSFKQDILSDIEHLMQVVSPTRPIKNKAITLEYPCIWEICKPLELIKNSDPATKKKAYGILEKLIKFYHR